jgi:hypothetical protein
MLLIMCFLKPTLEQALAKIGKSFLKQELDFIIFTIFTILFIS